MPPESGRKRSTYAIYIQKNYTPYTGDESFLQPPTERTKAMLEKYEALCREEQKNGGVLKIDTDTVITITSFGPGYLDKENEIIVGLQTDEPLKRACNPFGGMRMVRSACEAYGYKVSDTDRKRIQIPQDAQRRRFPPPIPTTCAPHATRASSRACRTPTAADASSATTARVALYGVDRLILQKKADKAQLGKRAIDADTIRLMEEVADQITALNDMKKMAEMYGYDISRPAENAREAVQWVYFAYLAAIKEQNGAAMSLGRVSTFLDIYFERDLKEGTLDESGAQEIIDDFVLKLRMARHLRTPEYNELFGGDPMWITESPRRHRRGRPHARDEKLLPHAAHALQPAPLPGAEPHGALGEAPAGKLEALRREGLLRHGRDPSMRATRSCARRSATTTRSPAASRRCASAATCSSSAPGQTSQSSCCSRSTAAWTRSRRRASRPKCRSGPMSTSTSTDWSSASTSTATGSPRPTWTR